MATPRIDDISLQFARKIYDAYTSAGVAFTAGTEAGIKLSAAERMAYINQALFVLFNTYWEGLQGDKETFAKMFPELVVQRSFTTDGYSKYVIANPNLDYFELLEAVSETKYLEVIPKHLKLAATYGSVTFQASSSIPKIIEAEGTIYILPDVSAFQSAVTIIRMIKQPVNPTNGALLTQGGSYDSPYNIQWNVKLAEIAKELYFKDAGMTA